MPLWSDNFDRADGALGSNWSTSRGSVSVSSNKALGQNNSVALAGPVTGLGSAMAEAVVTLGTDYSTACYPIIKVSADGTYYYGARAFKSGSNLQLDILSNSTQGFISVNGYSLVGGATTGGTLRIEYNGGALKLYWNGTLYCQGTHTFLAANTRLGMLFQTTANTIDTFTASGDGAPQLIVTPRVVGTDDGDQLLSLLGVAVTWTPGSPGSPAFTVNSGALSAQQISSTSNATVLFSPPTSPGTVLLSDTVDGISATITVVSGSYVGGSGVGGGVIPSSVVDWLTLQANHGGLVLSDIDALTGAPAPDKIKKTLGDFYLWLASLLGEVPSSPPETPVASTLWRLINGGYYSEIGPFPEPSFTTLDAGLGTIDGKLNTLVTDANWNLAELLFSLGGNPVKSHQDIIDALGSLGGGSNTEVLDAIAAARGDTTTSLATLLSSLAGIRTTDAYSLGDVKEWVDALPHGETGPTALAVAAAVAAIGAAIVTGGAAIPVEAVAIGAGPLLDMATLVEVASIIGELAGIASSIASIRASLAAPVATGAPVWPGESAVILGTSHALADGLIVDGPMHGLIVTISGHPSGAGKYAFGSIESWQHCGAVVFKDDAGHYERAESFGLPSQILTPRTMAEAASATVRLNGGWSGTIRGWSVTP